MMNPEIMLFGAKIILPESGRVMTGGEYSGESCVESSNGSGGVVNCDRCLEGDREKNYVEEKHELADEDQEEELCQTTEPDEEDQNPNESHDDDDASKTENEQSGSSSAVDGQPKTLKKPDKILPCPRCNSSDTKFCYFNNYNVNQPRHFCKGCQRYWTDGGTMRNVPVGAGRRKNKNYYARHLTISDPRVDNASDGLVHLKSSVLSFGQDAGNFKNGPAMPNPNGLLSPFASYPAIYPMPYYYAQPAVWNCNNIPWVSVNQSPLGKHSRDGETLITTENSEGGAAKRRVLESSVVVPKTLRIGDPEEAARSSIWSTLGIENRGGLLKALQPKGGEKMSTLDASPLMLANPAALSRSISFQERI